MADKKIKVQVDVDPEGNILETAKNLRTLKQQLKEVPAGTADWSKIKNQIRDIEDSLESAGQSSEDFKGLLEAAPGPLGVLGGAIKKVELATKSWSAALKATGIGLLVAAIGGLVAAFSQTEGSMKKLEPLLIGMEKIFGGLVEAFQPLLDAFLEMALKVLPWITQKISQFYGGLVSLFTFIKEGATGIGKIIKGVFTLDTDAIKEGYEQLKGTWDKTVERYEQFQDDFEKGSKKLTKTEKENAKTAKELADKAEEERKKRLAERLKDLDSLEKLNEAELSKEKELALGLAQTEQEKLDIETAFAKKKYDLQKKQLEDKKKLLDPKKDKEEYQATLVALAELDANRIKEVNGFNEQQKKINEDNLKSLKDFENRKREILAAATKNETQRALAERKVKYEKDLQDLEEDKEFIKKSEEEKAQLRKALLQGYQNDTAKIENDAQLKKIDEELKLVAYRNDTLMQGTKAYFEGRRELLSLEEKKELAALDLTESQKTAIKEKYAKLRKDIDRDELAAFGQTISATIDAVANLGNAIAASMDEEAKTSEKAFKQRKALLKATALMSAASGIIQILTQPSTLPSPIDWIVKGINAAALAVMTAIQIKNIDNTKFEGGGATGGSSSATTAPNIQAPQVAASTPPQIQLPGQSNPATQIAQTINTAQAPIKAYVVSGEISSQQALDRRTSRAATFTGG